MTVGRGSVSPQALRRVLGVVAGIVLLALWQIAGKAGISPYLPPMSDAVGAAWDMVTGPQLKADILPSVGRALAGLIIGCLLGMLAGVVIGYGRLHEWVRPTLEFLRSLPIVAIAPVVLIAFTPGSATRVGIIALASFWPVFVNTEDAARSVDERLIETARAYGRNRSWILFRLVGPATLPMAVAGARIATSVSLLAMVVSEFFLATSGLGYQLQYDARGYDVAGMFGAILILGIIGRVMSGAFNGFEHWVLRWYLGQKGLTQ